MPKDRDDSLQAVMSSEAHHRLPGGREIAAGAAENIVTIVARSPRHTKVEPALTVPPQPVTGGEGSFGEVNRQPPRVSASISWWQLAVSRQTTRKPTATIFGAAAQPGTWSGSRQWQTGGIRTRSLPPKVRHQCRNCQTTEPENTDATDACKRGQLSARCSRASKSRPGIISRRRSPVWEFGGDDDEDTAATQATVGSICLRFAAEVVSIKREAITGSSKFSCPVR